MLQDLRQTYVRRERRGLQGRPATLKATAIWLVALLASAALLFAFLKFGTLLTVEDLSTFSLS